MCSTNLNFSGAVCPPAGDVRSLAIPGEAFQAPKPSAPRRVVRREGMGNCTSLTGAKKGTVTKDGKGGKKGFNANVGVILFYLLLANLGKLLDFVFPLLALLPEALSTPV